MASTRSSIMTNEERAQAIRVGVLAYLKSRYGCGDLSWHPLFAAARDLFCWLMDGR